MKIYENVAYGELAEQRLDVYLPDTKNFPTVVHFHGGGMETGDKADGLMRETAEYLLSRGIACVQVNYRMYPNGKYPQFIEDAARAVAYVRTQVKEWGGNGKVIVSGQSAGAYLSMMLCLDERYLRGFGADSREIDGWFIDSAQQTTHFNVLRERGEDPDLQRIDEAAPLYYVNKQTQISKMKLVFYTQDMFCRLEQNMLLYRAICGFCGEECISYEILEGGHCSGSSVKQDGVYPTIVRLADFVLER